MCTRYTVYQLYKLQLSRHDFILFYLPTYKCNTHKKYSKWKNNTKMKSKINFFLYISFS